MAIKIAIGPDRPYLLPSEVFPSEGVALLRAKVIFALLSFKCHVSIWETELEFVEAKGTLLDQITPITWRGQRVKEDMGDYPTGYEPGT